jgi:hypothetical protein
MPRNSSGVYVLPTGNPVITATTVSSSWANTTMADIGTEITNSLDRQGRGGMLVAFKTADGTASLPGYAFTNEPTLGIARLATGVMSLVSGSTVVGTIDGNGFNGKIGGTTPAAGKFTDLSATSPVFSAGASVLNVTGNPVQLLIARGLQADGAVGITLQGGTGGINWNITQAISANDLIVSNSALGTIGSFNGASGNLSLGFGLSVTGDFQPGGNITQPNNKQATLGNVVLGSLGSSGYGGEFSMRNPSSGVPTPKKFLRVNPNGDLEIVNDAASVVIMRITDAGEVFFPGIVHGAGFAS